MRVLKEGPKKNVWVLETKCTGWGNSNDGCGAELEIELSDLVHYIGVPGDTWGSRPSAYSFKCVLCGCCTDLGINNQPKDKLETTKIPTVTSAWYNK